MKLLGELMGALFFVVLVCVLTGIEIALLNCAFTNRDNAGQYAIAAAILPGGPLIALALYIKTWHQTPDN